MNNIQQKQRTTEEIPGLGVCAEDLRFLAERVAGALGVNGSSVETILEHSICQAVVQLGDVVEQLENTTHYAQAAAIRRIISALECAQETAATLNRLLSIEPLVKS